MLADRRLDIADPHLTVLDLALIDRDLVAMLASRQPRVSVKSPPMPRALDDPVLDHAGAERSSQMRTDEIDGVIVVILPENTDRLLTQHTGRRAGVPTGRSDDVAD